jgi:glycosyltransferase involved in cell wall biosynthesis
MLGIQTLILELRPDLRFILGKDLSEDSDAYLGWLLTSGIREYAALRDGSVLSTLLVDFQMQGFGPSGTLRKFQYLVWKARPDVQQVFPLPDKRTEYLDWFYTHGLEEHGFWYFLTSVEQTYVLQLPEPWHSRISKTLLELTKTPEPRISFNDRPFGVNLVGYAFGQLGIGEDARMAARAMLAANVPISMLNFLPGTDIPQNDLSMAQHVTDQGAFAFNVFCMTALENGRYYAERGGSQFRDRYNIGYWPWELSRWPKQWESIIDLVDEVWVSTQHTFDALIPVCSKPLYLMPMAVELGHITEFESCKKAREHFNLPVKARLFCFSFDLNSSFYRKNPQACVDAFLQAFSREDFSEDQVGLVIKVHPPAKHHAAWEKLKALAATDARIHIVERTLPRNDLLALYKACDCFVSLHRAEGFGRGIAEALQLGIHVITTAYSGNIDFCHAPHSDLVRYRLIKVKKGQYPYGENQVWAEIDVSHAAQCMLDFVRTRHAKLRMAKWPEFSASVVGDRYRQRLREIFSLNTSEATQDTFTCSHGSVLIDCCKT